RHPARLLERRGAPLDLRLQLRDPVADQDLLVAERVDRADQPGGRSVGLLAAGDQRHALGLAPRAARLLFVDAALDEREFARDGAHALVEPDDLARGGRLLAHQPLEDLGLVLASRRLVAPLLLGGLPVAPRQGQRLVDLETPDAHARRVPFELRALARADRELASVDRRPLGQPLAARPPLGDAGVDLLDLALRLRDQRGPLRRLGADAGLLLREPP